MSDRVIRDASFARRLRSACDSNPLIPPFNQGRLTWIKAQFKERYGVSISHQSIHKWYSGEARPRPDKCTQLAEMLGVEANWLRSGINEAEVTAKQPEIARNPTVPGMVNALAGFIAMDGGAISFPEPDDKRAATDSIDLYAIFGGRNHFIHVAAGEVQGDQYRFPVPDSYQNVVVVGSVREGLCLRITTVDPDLVRERGVRRAGVIELTMTHEEFIASQIEHFRKPI